MRQSTPNPEDQPIRVGYVEDHDAVRKSIETMLGRRGCVVTASAATAADGYAAMEASPPDVAIVDINLPDEPGGVLVRRLLARHPDLKVLIYTGAQDETMLRDALDTGARGFALKAGSLHELREAIGAIARGDTYMDPRLRSTFLGRRTTATIAALTPREREILDLLARGHTGEEAAKVLFLSPETIRVHVRNAMRKLGAGTRVHAVVLALQQGEIDV
jgi:DNA-binding NarL/FixJ family response regulator